MAASGSRRLDRYRTFSARSFSHRTVAPTPEIRSANRPLCDRGNVIAHLAVTPKVQWQKLQARKLKNQDPIYEIRYGANDRATRALGYFAPEGATFVIVRICHHKGRVYEPHDAFRIAHRRIRQIGRRDATTVPLQVDGENFPPDDE